MLSVTLNGAGADELAEGTTVVGETSGATGLIKSTVLMQDNNNNPDRNVNNHIYNVLLSNYTGQFVEGEAIVPQVTPASFSTFTYRYPRVPRRSC